MTDQDQLLQVESWLGRPLTQGELLPVESLDVLSPAQLAVVQALAPRSAFVAMLYLRNIVSTALVKDLQPFVDEFASGCRSAQPKEWPNLALFERYAGRALSIAEKQSVTSLHELAPAHRAMAATLALREPTVALLYLRRVAPSAAADACDTLVKQLASEAESGPQA